MPGTLSPWPVVKNGNKDHPIKTLQYLLRARGHTVTVDGVFGPKTEAAVKAFQTSKGLSASGIVGPETWTAVVVTVKKGSHGDAVRGVQEESGTCQATPARAFKWTGTLGRRRTVLCGVSSMLCPSTFLPSPWTGSSDRSPGKPWSVACCPSSTRVRV